MRILLALDGSSCSGEALREILDRTWPAHSEVRVLSVARAAPLPLGASLHGGASAARRHRAEAIVARAMDAVRAGDPQLRVTGKVREGLPEDLVLEEAEEWGADLVVLGSHEDGALRRSLAGSVSRAAALRAPCSVEIVRRRGGATAGEASG